jgi:hypothetical protein
MAAIVITMETTLICVYGFSDVSQNLIDLSISCYIAIACLPLPIAKVLKLSVSLFARIKWETHRRFRRARRKAWARAEDVCDRVRGAGSKAWDYVFGLVREV